jgi:hypothetical protein
MKKGLLFFLSCLYVLLSHATTYYVDQNGNDQNNGTSIITPWKTIAKVNSTWLQGGDIVAFKRGQTWSGQMINPPTRGYVGLPITFDAYGEGPQPIINGRTAISGSKFAGSWSETFPGSHVWVMIFPTTAPQGRKTPHRIWLDGKEYSRARTTATVNGDTRWTYDPGYDRLYIYALSNPALFYTTLEYPGIDFTIRTIEGHWLIQNLDLRGGLWSTVNIVDCSDVTIQNCTVGIDAGFIGINSYLADNIIIRNNEIDSGDRLVDSWYLEDNGPNDGIHLGSNSDGWLVYENNIKNWGHNGIYAYNEVVYMTMNNNKIYKNYVTCPDIDYGRGIGFDVVEGCVTTGNEVYLNTFVNLRAPNQIDCPGLLFHDNLIDSVLNSVHGGKASDSATGYGLAIGGYFNTAPHDMQIFNNTIINCDEPGFYIYRTRTSNQARNNVFRNNKVYNNGNHSTKSSNKSGYQIYVTNDLPVLNNTFTDNWLFNLWTDKVVYNGHASTDPFNKLHQQTVYEFNNSNGMQGDVINCNLNIMMNVK